MIGLAKDGHKIYGPYDDDGENWQPGDVDVCNGRFINGEYAYVTTRFYPYTIGCWGPGPVTSTFSPTCTQNSKNDYGKNNLSTYASFLQLAQSLIIGLAVLIGLTVI